MQNIKKAVKISREISNQVEELIGGAHHEINNLIFLIGTSAEIMPMLDSSKKRQEMLENIEKKVIEVNQTMTNLRSIVKDSSLEEPENISITDIIDTSVHLCKRRFNNHHVILKTMINKEFFLLNRKNQLIQSLLTLLNNSNDAVASSSAQANRWIELIVKEKKGKLEIIVKDSAPLMNSEDVHKLFNEDFDVQGRKGLSLAIVNENIIENGGSVKYKVIDGHNAIIISFKDYKLNNSAEENTPAKLEELLIKVHAI